MRQGGSISSETGRQCTAPVRSHRQPLAGRRHRDVQARPPAACCRCWQREGQAQAGGHLIQQQVDIECGQGGCNHSTVGAAGGHIFCQRRLQVAGPRLLVRPQQGKPTVVHILHGQAGTESSVGGGKRQIAATCVLAWQGKRLGLRLPRQVEAAVVLPGASLWAAAGDSVDGWWQRG